MQKTRWKILLYISPDHDQDTQDDLSDALAVAFGTKRKSSMNYKWMSLSARNRPDDWQPAFFDKGIVTALMRASAHMDSADLVIIAHRLEKCTKEKHQGILSEIAEIRAKHPGAKIALYLEHNDRPHTRSHFVFNAKAKGASIVFGASPGRSGPETANTPAHFRIVVDALLSGAIPGPVTTPEFLPAFAQDTLQLGHIRLSRGLNQLRKPKIMLYDTRSGEPIRGFHQAAALTLWDMVSKEGSYLPMPADKLERARLGRLVSKVAQFVTQRGLGKVTYFHTLGYALTPYAVTPVTPPKSAEEEYPFRFDEQKRVLIWAGDKKLDPAEAHILSTLLKKPGEVILRDALISGNSYGSFKVQMSRLRAKFTAVAPFHPTQKIGAEFLENHHNTGYMALTPSQLSKRIGEIMRGEIPTPVVPVQRHSAK